MIHVNLNDEKVLNGLLRPKQIPLPQPQQLKPGPSLLFLDGLSDVSMHARALERRPAEPTIYNLTSGNPKRIDNPTPKEWLANLQTTRKLILDN